MRFTMCTARACRAIDSPGTSYSPLLYVYALTHARTHTTGTYMQTRRRRRRRRQRRRCKRWRASTFEPPFSSLRHRPPRILIELSLLLMRLRLVSVESLASELRASASVCVRACTGHAAASGTLLIYSRTR